MSMEVIEPRTQAEELTMKLVNITASELTRVSGSDAIVVMALRDIETSQHWGSHAIGSNSSIPMGVRTRAVVMALRALADLIERTEELR